MKHTSNTGGLEPKHEGNVHEPLKSNTVIINGRPKEVVAKELGFTDIVRLAFDDAVFNSTTIYTITFKRGHGDKPEGSLVEGESIKVKDGMIFNVARTDKS